jgi:drug/metabolite transporter (DMT)-like permease
MKVIGYILAVVGLIIVILGSGFFGDFNYFDFDSLYVSIGGVVLIIVGALVSAKGSGGRKKNKSGEDEIPIYEGVGKKRRIVGYRKG